MPFPMPRSVICSPSHMTKAVPVVRLSMVIRIKPMPGLSTNPPSEFCKVNAIPTDCTKARMTVR